MNLSNKFVTNSSNEQSHVTNEVKKRDKYAGLNKNFQFNLKTLNIIAIKPNQVKKEHFDLEKRAQDIPTNIRDKIQNELFKKPNERYEHPVLQSHEYGWDYCPFLNSGMRRSKYSSDVTKYATEYFKLNNESPFTSIKKSKLSGETQNK